MYLCVLCRFLVELDDAMLTTEGGCCICLRCFSRETETAVSMSNILRDELVVVLAGAEVA